LIGRWAAAATGLCFIAACSAGPSLRAIAAGADGVSYEFSADRRSEATHEAALYCANLGRIAVLKHIEIASDGRATAVYACR
jgi:hypothetical protein